MSQSAETLITVIIPAYNAADSLSRTLDSLLSQTSFGWEAIVVDDGSSDETAEIARAYGARTPQIRVVTQPKGGVGSARNNGMATANGEWVVCLDADDWMAPTAIERYTAAISDDVDMIIAGSERVTADGSHVRDPFRLDPSKLFVTVARHCPFAIHACVFRRSIADAVGGFEPSYVVGADWDFWQRAARTAPRVVVLDDVLAYYRARPNSAVLNVERLLEFGSAIIRMGHTTDARVKMAAPEYAAGVARNRQPAALLNFICWPAGMLIGSGGDPTAVFRVVDEETDPAMDPNAVAHSIYLSGLLPRSLPESAWPGVWSTAEPRIEAFLRRLEVQSKTPDLARRARLTLERLIVERSDKSRPLSVGSTLWLPIELTEPVPDVRADAKIDVLLIDFLLEGNRLGTVELPGANKFIPRAVLLDAAVDNFGWELLNRYLGRHVYPLLDIHIDNQTVEVWRNGNRLAAGLPLQVTQLETAMHEAIGWTVLLQELWGEPGRSKEWFYDSSAPENESHSTEDIRTGSLEISAPLAARRTSDSEADLDLRVGGTPVGVVNVRSHDGIISRSVIRARCTSEAGHNIYRAALREGIIGQPVSNPDSLRSRLEAAASKRISGAFRSFVPIHAGGDGHKLADVNAPPAISLIVCTRNRARQLPPTLNAIVEMQPQVAWELVVVDNGSTDDTPELLQTLARNAPFPVKIVRENRAGLAAARNAGAVASRGSVLVFTDDDCYPAPDFVNEYVRVFANPEIGYATGRILLHDPNDFPITIRTDAEPFALPPRTFIEPGRVQGANMAFRREVLFALGGFDPALGPGGMFNFEDLDMTSRASFAGYAGGYFPGPTVRHHHGRRQPEDIAALRKSYAGGRGAYFASLIMRGAPKQPLARHLRDSLSRKPKGEVVREIVSAVHYTAYRLVRRPEHPLSPQSDR